MSEGSLSFDAEVAGQLAEAWGNDHFARPQPFAPLVRAAYEHDNGWHAWELDWEASGPGRHALRARATDSRGNTQPAAARWNKYGYGSNGVQITVVDTR